MDKETVDKISDIFKSHGEVKLAYLFGSQATGQAGPMSDFDFAFYADGVDKSAAFDLKLKLMDEIGLLLKTDKIDMVNLNFAENSELKYAIIRDGIIIFEQEPYRLLVEPRILNEYFDFHDLLKRHNLTKS